VNFLWPLGLWLLLVVPALIADYSLVRARVVRAPVHHAPAALFILAITLLLLAVARPTVRLMLPAEAATVILAIDVSASMRATDVEPTRLGAAQAAAREFVKGMPPGVRIGVVAFATEAQVVQSAVAGREEVLRAIDSLAAHDNTAIGSGILASLQALLPDAPHDPGLAIRVSSPAVWPAPGRADAATAIILLTDGQNSHGPDPMEAAHLAAKLGVRVFTIGVGSAHGRILEEGGWSSVVGIDEASLEKIAAITGAEYSYALSAWHLKRIYARLGSKVVLARTRTEIGGLLSAVAAAVATVAAGLSLLWFGRVL
jgi:Ca-activated chloride channel family protein